MSSLPEPHNIIHRRSNGSKINLSNDMVMRYLDGDQEATLYYSNNLSGLIHILVETEDNNQIRFICTLFNSKNSYLIEKLSSSSIELSSFINGFHRIKKPNQTYKIGCLSYIMEMALSISPRNVFLNIYKSKDFFTDLLRFIDVTSVFSLLNSMINSLKSGTQGFLWGYFLALKPDNFNLNPPNNWRISNSCIMECANVQLTESKRIIIYRMFNVYLSLHKDEKEFKEIIKIYICDNIKTMKDTEEIAELLNLAMCYPLLEEPYEAALDIIKNQTDLSSPSYEKAILYLSCYSIDVCELINVFQILLSPFGKNKRQRKKPNNLILLSATNLFKATFSNGQIDYFFMKSIQHIIGYYWNKKRVRSNLLIRSFLLSCSGLFNGFPTFPEWNQFINKVIVPYKMKQSCNLNFSFKGNDWDNGLLKILKKEDVETLKLEKIKTIEINVNRLYSTFDKRYIKKSKKKAHSLPKVSLPKSDSNFSETAPNLKSKDCYIS